MEIIGYELLYRDSERNTAEFEDGNHASSETIVNSFIHTGIDNLVGTSLAFVNLPSEFILNNALMDKPMIDLLDTIILSPQIKFALLDYENDLGIILKNCILYEKAQFLQLQEENINTEHYKRSYMTAVKWADETIRELNNNV